MVLLLLLLIDWTNLFIFLFLSFIFLRFNLHVLDDQEVFKRLFLRVSFLKKFHFGILFFGVLFFISESLIIDQFVCIIWIRIHWSWKFYSGVLKIFCGPHPNQTYTFASPKGLWMVVSMVTVGCSELFTSIYCFSWSEISFQLFVQAFLCFFYLRVLHLIGHCSLILKLFLGCVRKCSVGIIQTRHTALIPLQVCGRSWWGWRFFGISFHHQLIDRIQVNYTKFFKFIINLY